MLFEYEDQNLKNFSEHQYTGKYKAYKSNAKLIRDFDKVLKYIGNADNIVEVSKINSLGYEKLQNSIYLVYYQYSKTGSKFLVFS